MAAAGSGLLRSPVVALTAATLFWSGNFVVGRAIGGHVDPLTLNLFRWLLALIIVLPAVGGDNLEHHLPVLRREWRLIVALGATGIASFHTLVYLALRSTTVTNALLMLSLAPVTIMIGAVFAGMDRMSGRLVVGGLLSILGAGVVSVHVESTLLLGLGSGDLLMFAAIVVWSVYSLLLRRCPADLPPAVAMAGSMVAGVALMLPPWLVIGSTVTMELNSVPVLLSIGYVGLFASAIAFRLWSYGVARLGPIRAGQFVHLMPVFGAGLAFAFLGEVLTPAQLVGAVLVLSGILVVEYRTANRSVPLAAAALKEPTSAVRL